MASGGGCGDDGDGDGIDGGDTPLLLPILLSLQAASFSAPGLLPLRTGALLLLLLPQAVRGRGSSALLCCSPVASSVESGSVVTHASVPWAAGAESPMLCWAS